MDEILRDFLVSLVAFLSISGIIYVFLMTRFKERMSMIDKGVDASLLASKSGSSPTLKFGMLFVGISLGLLTGNLLDKNDILARGVAYFSMMFLFGGISLILNYLIERRIKN